MMKKLMASGLSAAVLAAASLGASAPAQARHGNGGAIAAGVVGGLALGAIAGSAAANASPGYGYGGGYSEPAPVYGGGCYFTRQATYDPYGNFAGYRRVRVCE